MKINRHIEIARTTNSHFSSMGLKSCNMIRDVLAEYYEHVGVSTVNNITDLEMLVLKNPDLVFLGMKRLPFAENTNPSEAIWMSQYLDDNGINYTGSSKVAIEYDFNKESAKIQVRNSGLATAPFFTATPGQHVTADDVPIDYPLFVKPLDSGGGKGIGSDSVVNNFSEFQAKVESIFKQFGSNSIVESYLTGREFSVAILDHGKAEDLIVMPVELLTEKNAEGHRILGSQIKTEDNERIVAIKESSVKQVIGQLASDIYSSLGARDMGRIDIRMDADGKAFFLEANLVPGLADNDFISYFNRACLINEGMDYKSIILNITELGLSRSVGMTN